MHYPRIRKADKTNSTINLGENVTIMGKYIYIYILGIELLFKQGSLRKFNVIGEEISLFSPLKPTTEVAPRS